MSLSSVDLPEPLRPMRPVRPGLKVPLILVSAEVPFGHEKWTLRREMTDEMGMMSFEDLEPEMGAQDSHVLAAGMRFIPSSRPQPSLLRCCPLRSTLPCGLS